MKKLPAILLLTIYLATQVASAGWYLYKPLSHAWFSMLQQKSGDHELLVVTIDKDRMGELENEEGEIVIDGMLYDIEQSVIKGNYIQLHLEKDEGETRWNDHYSKWNNLLHKQTNSKTATAAKAYPIFVALFYPGQANNGTYFHKAITGKYYTLREKNYTSPYYGLLTPPPKYS